MSKQTKRLTPAQTAVLKQLLIGEHKSAYNLHASLNTLYALEKAGYLKAIGWGRLGATWSPRTTVEWERIR